MHSLQAHQAEPMREVACILWLGSLGATTSFLLNARTARRLHCSSSIPPLYSSNVLLDPTIQVKGVQLATIDGLRGIIATEAVGGDLQTSVPLVSVPANLVFEVTNTRPPTPFPDFVPQSLWEESMWDQRLAFKLLHELAVVGLINSDKASWLQQLPSSYSTPLHWSSDVLKRELQYASLASKVERQRTEWRAFYDKWQGLNNAPLAGRVKYDELVQALECVNSRAFSGAYEGSNAGDRKSLLLFTGALTIAFPLLNFGTWEQSLSAAVVVGLSILAKDVIFSKASGLKRYVVCPFVDMFNHKSTVSSDVSYNYFSNVFELRAEGHAKGDQVFISYGKQSNDRLLQFYGFVDKGNPYDSYDFGMGVLELLLKYGDAMMATAPLPVGPTDAQSRLKAIAAALSITEVEDSTIRGNRGATVRGDEVPVRFFRIAPKSKVADEAKGKTVEDILKQSATSQGVGDEGTIARFDSVTTRSLRALYSSQAEWAELVASSGRIGNLERLGAPLSPQTEKLVASALRSLASLELASKPTTLEEDVALLGGSKGGVSRKKGNKGFSSSSGDAASDATAAPNPSGPYQDAVYSAISFRIEKKRLLGEAMTMN